MRLVKKETGYFRSFDDTSIYYEVHGEGKPIVLAYGIACVMNHWQHQVKYFSEHYKVITFDYRGHHRSEVPHELSNLSFDALVTDLKLLCEYLGVTSASFWGHSFGTQVLIASYEKHRELFENFVFINGFARNPLQGMFGSSFPTRAFNLARLVHGKLPQTFEHLWKSVVQHPLMVPVSGLAGGFNLELTHLKDIEIYARGVSTLNLDSFLALFSEMTRYDGTEVVPQIEIPTMIISGARDSLTPQRIQLEFHKKIKKSEFLAVAVGTHCTQLDLPDLVNLRLEKFLIDHNY